MILLNLVAPLSVCPSVCLSPSSCADLVQVKIYVLTVHFSRGWKRWVNDWVEVGMNSSWFCQLAPEIVLSRRLIEAQKWVSGKILISWHCFRERATVYCVFPARASRYTCLDSIARNDRLGRNLKKMYGLPMSMIFVDKRLLIFHDVIPIKRLFCCCFFWHANLSSQVCCFTIENSNRKPEMTK